MTETSKERMERRIKVGIYIVLTLLALSVYVLAGMGCAAAIVVAVPMTVFIVYSIVVNDWRG